MTRHPVRLGISGAGGRMGQALLELLQDDSRFDVQCAMVAPASSRRGQPARTGGAFDGLRYSCGWANAPELDVIIDFSGPTGVAEALDHALAHGVALVTGTTGLDAEMERRLVQASADIAMLRAANFSLGVAVLTRLLRDAAAALPDWDLEILEAHHRLKRDAPSGTALALGSAAASARGTTLDAAAVHASADRTGERMAGSIGFQVVRGGDIVGEHCALLIGSGERLELAHRASDRSIFARGALQAAQWIAGRAAGSWQLDDVLGLTRHR